MEERIFSEFKPMFNKVVTTATLLESRTSNGIILPGREDIMDSVQTVISFGSSCSKNELTGEYNLKVGDKIIFDPERYAKTSSKFGKIPNSMDEQQLYTKSYFIPSYNIEGKKVLMIEETAIIAVVETL